MAYRVVYLDIIFIFSLSPALLSVSTQAHGTCKSEFHKVHFVKQLWVVRGSVSSAFSNSAVGVTFTYFLTAFLFSGVACFRRHIEQEKTCML